ncbi:hypothetical protein ACFSCW_15295 [Sphingomonas tabacisoli]|uniref:Uncharacterized protein n=1 Tax=Sphingomonas tabacisoli TaxID=2249466 RepID=A0ABW4I7A5_9SPHN
MNTDFTAIVISVLNQALHWIRSDLASKDVALRQRAEEALRR